MSDNKPNLDFDRAEAFIKSPAGTWSIITLLGLLVLGSIISTVAGWFG